MSCISGLYHSLTDQELKSNDIHLQQSISFYSEVKEFMKELADVEREYWKKLDALVKKYNHRKEKDILKRSTTLHSTVSATTGRVKHFPTSFGTVSANSTLTGFISDENESTTMKAWSSILSQIENIAKTRLNLSVSLHSTITENLKSESHKKDELRKKHLQFANTLSKERDAVYREKDRLQAKFNEQSELVNVSMQKVEKAPDEKTQEKLKKLWHQDILEMNNCKNLYLLQLGVANSVKQTYFGKEVPSVIQNLHQLSKDVTMSLRSILLEFTRLQSNSLSTYEVFVDQMNQDVFEIKGEADTAVFTEKTKLNDVADLEPPNFEFKSSGVWKEDAKMVTDEHAKIFLFNHMAQLKANLTQVDEEIANKDNAVQGLNTLWDTYRNQPLSGDASDVLDKIHDAKYEMHLLQINRIKIATQIQTIRDEIGDFPDDFSAHEFRPASFAIPTTCNFCQQSLWGVSKAGLSCKDCGFNVHVRCEMKTAATCMKVKVPPAPKKASSVKHTDSINRSLSADHIKVVKNASSVNTFRNDTSHESLLETLEAIKLEIKKPSTTATVLYSYERGLDCEEEISVKEGDIVTVIEGDDGTGWTMVELDGKTGLVPTSYIYLTMVCLYDYEKVNDDDLNVKKGEMVSIINQDDGAGWTTVRKGNDVGAVPTTYLGFV